jgi:uncharacterized protein YndB with AHSA1/START domain
MPRATEQPTRFTPAQDGAELRLVREFDAPRELVWLAWARAEIMVRWLGPRDWPAVEVKQDLQVGGCWSARLASVHGPQFLIQSGVYREIAPPSRLAFTFAWAEGHEDGSPVETLVTIELEDLPDQRTQMTFTQAGLKSSDSAMGHRRGWTESFDRLGASLESDILERRN